MPQFLSTDEPGFEAAFQSLLGAKREDSPDVDDVVADFIAQVRDEGDAAVLRLTAKFDRTELTAQSMRMSAEEIDAQCALVSEEEAAALELAAARIRAYHARQMPKDEMWVDEAGATLGWRWTPVSAAGLYVPGGTASYPSSVLMNAIPAAVAGVERLVITLDRGFGDVQRYPPGSHAGILVLRVDDQSSVSVCRTLSELVEQNAIENLAGCVAVFRNGDLRVRRPTEN